MSLLMKVRILCLLLVWGGLSPMSMGAAPADHASMGQETSQDISRHDLTHFIADYRYYEPGDIVPDVYLTPPYVIKAWWLRNLPPPVAPLTAQWRRHLEASALPAAELEGWYQGMQQLQQLTTRLNRLDEQKGKYMTVSELKSQVFAITQAFSSAVLAEEQLRRLGQVPVADAAGSEPVT
ncbi:VasL domain-containing protein [Citrobacter werkmanii]|uniref:VasL domain-containing protein n=1 Tax=Citrobacter werkmanii TaxID=67827 RepID=UPI003F5A778C